MKVRKGKALDLLTSSSCQGGGAEKIKLFALKNFLKFT